MNYKKISKYLVMLASLFMIISLATYLFILLFFAVRYLLTNDKTYARFLGVAVILIVLLGFWILGKSLIYGFKLQQLSSLARNQEINLDEYSRAEYNSLLDEYKQKLETMPSDWFINYQVAKIYYQLGNKTEGRKLMKQAIQLQEGK